MQVALRIDIGSLKKPERLPDGRLRVDGVLTRTGVFSYRMPDGSIRREYRPDAEVFSAAALATFADATVTDDHPPQMITAANAKQFGVGMLSGAPRRTDANQVAATMVIADATAISKVEQGKSALSCGYEVDLVETPGTAPSGEKYDAIQTNIRGNHVAIVSSGRAGPEARIRMDAGYQETPEPTVNLEQALAALAAANEKIGAEKSRADKAEASLTAGATALAAEKARADAAEVAVKAAEKARTDAAAALPAVIKARVALEGAATKVLGEAFKADASDRDLMVAVVKRVDNADIATDAHEAYVQGRFEAAIARAQTGAVALAGGRVVAEAGRNDSNVTPAAKARQDMIDRDNNAWKTSAKGSK